LSTETETQPLLRLDHVSKNFGPVQALSDVNLELRAGEVTALIGDNGAGKSVTIKTISGIHGPDSGQIYWEGRPVRIRTPREAAALGIETVFQDLALCDNLDIVQNLFLGRERTNHGITLDEEAMEKSAAETLASLAVTTVRSIRQPVASLSRRQSVAIARRCSEHEAQSWTNPRYPGRGPRRWCSPRHVWPSAPRGDADLAQHERRFEVADRIAVLFLGRVVALLPAADLDRQIAVDLMTTGQSARLSTNGHAAKEPERA
jgi:ABC-type sugar transport system ATPase subunit